MAKRKYELAGKTFSRLTVSDYGDGMWNCTCVCGGTKKVHATNLMNGRVQSCGCLAKEVAGKAVKLDIPTGMEFTSSYGTLRIVKEVGSRDQFRMFEVSCFCGGNFSTRLNSLRTGNTKSCGCMAHTGDSNRSHGMTGTKTYIRWKSMLTRATNSNIRGAKNYSLRGIGVCDRWLKFENFLEDMGEMPRDRPTLERVDNDLGYSPENCVWATVQTQSRNKRRVNTVSGIQQLPSGKWRAQINPDAESLRLHIGTYATKEEAEAARLEAEEFYWK